MPIRVHFRFNVRTGEVEEFLVDDQDRQLPEAEHDRIAAEVARFITAQPRLGEALPSAAAPPARSSQAAPGGTPEAERASGEPAAAPAEEPAPEGDEAPSLAHAKPPERA